MRPALHTFEEHTSEVQVHLEAPDLPALFEEAGRALAELMVGEAAGAAQTDGWEDVELRASDRETLLVDWLNELIFRGEVAKKVYVQFEIRRLGERELKAAICGYEPGDLRTAVKAATLHGLQITQQPTGWSGTVVLDV
jgi:SHS2 domain-containing protein